MSWQELCLIHCFLCQTAMFSSIYHLVNVCWFNPNNFYVTTTCWKVTYISESSPVWGAFFLTSSCNLEGSMTCDLLWPARWRQTWQIPLWAEPGSFLVERVIVPFPSPTPTVTISFAKESLSLCLRVIGKARSAWQPVWIPPMRQTQKCIWSHWALLFSSNLNRSLLTDSSQHTCSHEDNIFAIKHD